MTPGLAMPGTALACVLRGKRCARTAPLSLPHDHAAGTRRSRLATLAPPAVKVFFNTILQQSVHAKTFTFIMTHIWFYAISKKTGDSKMHCRKCGSEAFTKNGFVAGTQRYKCKQCGFQFTRETSHGKPMKDKILALILYLSGMSMNMIGKIVGVSTQSVMRWINMFYEKFAANDESQSNIEEIEVDEMVSYITKKKITSGSGKLLIITLENLSAGNVVIVVPKP